MAETEQLILWFKALADPVRLRIVSLCSAGECSVSELTEVLGQSQPRVSQHLKQLCDAGLLERFRDGHFVYYRVASEGPDSAERRRLLALLPDEFPGFRRDIDKLGRLRGLPEICEEHDSDADRSLYRALLEQTVTTPLGDLIDIGSGQGQVLKLLASRARRAVGVDVDSDARRFARAQLLLAGLPNCTLRKGNMYGLPFPDADFDTVILDDVLLDAERPAEALAEAERLLRPGGRLLILVGIGESESASFYRDLAGWCAESGLRLAAPRPIPVKQPRWLLVVATPHRRDHRNDNASAAA